MLHLFSVMKNPPARRQDEPRIVEPEIVGFEKKPSPLRGALSRVFFSIVMALVSLGLVAGGIVLTLSIIGAPLGIPLILAGLGGFLFAIFMFLGGGKIRVQKFRP